MFTTHLLTHEDPYPAALEALGAVLFAGYHADNIGGSEPSILQDITAAVRGVLALRDPASLVFIPQLVEEA